MNLPNCITLGRLLSVPVAVYLIMQHAYFGAFVLFLVAGISDALDGYIAKRFDRVTQLGAVLDPVADKGLLVGVYVTLGLQEIIPQWLVVLVVFRDIMIVGGVALLFLFRLEVRMRPLVVSKINTATQIAFAAVVLAELGLRIDTGWFEPAMVYAVAATTVISGAGYVVSWTRKMAGLEPDEPPGTS